MAQDAGVLRSAESLAHVRHRLGDVAPALAIEGPSSVAVEEVRNLVTIANAVVTAALVREESRGAHTRTDHPQRDEAFRTRLVLEPEFTRRG
jgi:aspartate oxidase